ncbi:alpha-L-fucosidase [Amycolatopsis sp. PS_44_ISF1]|uniref:alpha-L-fucosidase n=1 Tax=Amycolatopsis sp. PS_44_ISF1 TaxID=2974917 RepID=UPI0028DE7C97|nr:alpha-L-fucosidase [Amycolatopsis sp. PS_44_ISF1]MDT8913328.1 alpha-L-fucosidase [Amycolatopsis sp. PS_44_ISF1]
MPISTHRALLVAGVLALGVPGPAAAAPGTGCTGPIRPAAVLAVRSCDGMDRILAKAAAVVPRPGQLDWQQRPVTGFTHFGMNTFTDREWGSGAERESSFAPRRADTGQWMRAMKAAGITQVMLTVKHHDGFVLYPTRYTNHSVIASPWWVQGCAGDDPARGAAQQARAQDPSAFWRVRATGCANPRGDLLRDYVDSARAAGLKVGVYLSPADGAELPASFFAGEVERIGAKVAAGQPLSIEEQATYDDRAFAPSGQGRYGSGSAVTPRTIPSLVPGDDRAAALAAGRLPRFSVREDDYNSYYLNQLYELFTQYGPIDELWLDGANPWRDHGIGEDYDFTTWFRMIHAFSPDTVTFAGPAGVRWVGNESGRARETEWSPLPVTADPATAHNEELFPGGASAEDLGSRAVLADPSVRYLQWAPAESDVSLRPGWFFHAGEQPKTAARLVSLYRQTVGRNSSLLLNVPPAPDGTVPPGDRAALAAFGASVAATQAVNLAKPGPGVPRSPAVDAVTDDALRTSWSPPHGAREGTLDLPLSRPVTFDQIRLGEDLGRGQHIEGATVEAEAGGVWRTVTTVTTVGSTRLVTLPAPVTADRVRVLVTQSRATPYLATFALYRTVAPPG